MIDYLNKPGKELLLDLVNDDNKSTFTFEQVSFGPPVVVSMNQDERNTSCVVTADPTSPWYGSTPIYYERLFFERMFVDQDVEASSDEVQNDAQLLAALNAEFGLEMQPTDVTITGTYPRPGHKGEVTVTAKPGSYVYLGEFIVTFVGNKIQLIDYITHKVLDGLNYIPGPPVFVTKPRQFNAMSLAGPAADADGAFLFYPTTKDAMTFQGTNAEVQLALAGNKPGKISKGAGGAYDFAAADVTEIALSIALTDASEAAGDVLSQYDVFLRFSFLEDGAEQTVSSKLIKKPAGGEYRFVTEDEEPSDLVFNILPNASGKVLQFSLFNETLRSGEIKSVSLVAVRKDTFAARVVLHVPMVTA